MHLDLGTLASCLPKANIGHPGKNKRWFSVKVMTSFWVISLLYEDSPAKQKQSNIYLFIYLL